MKFIAYTVLIIVVLIKYIESCMRLTGCSWGEDPCNKYSDMNACLKQTGCKWGDLEDIPESPVNIEISLGNEVKVEPKLNDNSPKENPNNNMIIICQGKNFKPCYFNCQIF